MLTCEYVYPRKAEQCNLSADVLVTTSAGVPIATCRDHIGRVVAFWTIDFTDEGSTPTVTVSGIEAT